MNEKDNIAVITRHVDDVNVAVKFRQIIDSDGDQVFARVYDLSGNTIGNIENEVVSAGLKGHEITLLCDFSAIPSGKNYYVKFYTSEGVLAKAHLIVYNTDGFTLGAYPV